MREYVEYFDCYKADIMENFPSIGNDKPTAGGRLIGTGVVGSLHERPPAAAYNVVRADPAFGGYALCSHRGEILSLLTTYRMRINSRAVSQLKKDVHGILKKSFKRQ